MTVGQLWQQLSIHQGADRYRRSSENRLTDYRPPPVLANECAQSDDGGNFKVYPRTNACVKEKDEHGRRVVALFIRQISFFSAHEAFLSRSW